VSRRRCQCGRRPTASTGATESGVWGATASSSGPPPPPAAPPSPPPLPPARPTAARPPAHDAAPSADCPSFWRKPHFDSVVDAEGGRGQKRAPDQHRQHCGNRPPIVHAWCRPAGDVEAWDGRQAGPRHVEHGLTAVRLHRQQPQGSSPAVATSSSHPELLITLERGARAFGRRPADVAAAPALRASMPRGYTPSLPRCRPRSAGRAAADSGASVPSPTQPHNVRPVKWGYVGGCEALDGAKVAGQGAHNLKMDQFQLGQFSSMPDIYELSELPQFGVFGETEPRES